MPRPKVPLLSRAKIVEAALELIDEEGTDRFTIRHLARKLEVHGPSIYYYFRDRDEVFAAVGLTLLQDVRIPKRRAQKWTDWLVQDAVAYFRAIKAHPNVAPILFERRTRPGAAERFNAALERMQDSGIPPHEGLALIDAVEGLALSWVAGRASVSSEDEFGNLDRVRYPLLDQARRMHQMDEASFRRVVVALISGYDQIYGDCAEE